MADSRRSNLETHQRHAAFRDAIPAVATLVAAEALVAVVDLDPDTYLWHAAVALLPLIGGLWLVWVQWRSWRRCDEYQRRLQLEAWSCGFVVAMVVAMAGGLLGAVDVGSGATYLQLTFIGGILSWLGALAVLGRR